MSFPSIVSADAWRERGHAPLGRLVLIGITILVLLIPLTWIEGLVRERQVRHEEAVAEVAGKWGNAQELIGPVLRVPYRTPVVTLSDRGQQARYANGYAYFLARNLRADVKISSEERHRGMFSVPVYVADVELSGRFAQPDVASLGIDPADVDWAAVDLLLPVSDPRAIQADGNLRWNGTETVLQPALGGDTDWHLVGIHARLPSLAGVPLAAADFSLSLRVNGSGHLLLAPTAERTEAHFASNWPNPSFQAKWLPRTSEIRRDGFTADWSISYLGRDYPQAWTQASDYSGAMRSALFGVALASPVDDYRMTDRASKYALLIIFFTFAVFWLTEVLARRRMHALQYLLVGAALCLFGLLQLSLSEQFGFAAAFALSTVGITVMVTLYAKAALRSGRHALVAGAVLGSLYAYIYTLLKAEDYSLLGGSLALFGALGVIMYLTRSIDWFSLGRPAQPRETIGGSEPS